MFITERIKMPATYVHFSDELKKKKETTGKSWEEILVAGVESCFNGIREDIKNKLNRDTEASGCITEPETVLDEE
jgi:hypothetical protein